MCKKYFLNRGRVFERLYVTSSKHEITCPRVIGYDLHLHIISRDMQWETAQNAYLKKKSKVIYKGDTQFSLACISVVQTIVLS